MAVHIIESDLLHGLGRELIAVSDTLHIYEIRLRDEGKYEQADRISWRRRSLAEYREALREAPVMEAAQ